MKSTNFQNTMTALLIVDVQKAFLDKDYPGIKRNNLNAEKVCGLILNKWRDLNLPVIHIRHSSIDPSSKLHESKPGFLFNDYVLPQKNETVLTKHVNSGFIGTNLETLLKDQNIKKLLMILAKINPLHVLMLQWLQKVKTIKCFLFLFFQKF